MDEDEGMDDEFDEAGDGDVDPGDPEFEDELDDEEGLDDEDGLTGDADAGEDSEGSEDDEEDEDGAVPSNRARPSGDDDDDDDDVDPDDVEADLDTILKDRIASGDDEDEDEEEEAPADRNDPEAAEGVVSKREGEFTCTQCFMIVHPRQFGRKGKLVCPSGEEDCPSIPIVEAQLG